MCKKTKDLNYNNKEEALEILKRFTKKYLHGKIDELADFSFWDILTDTEFNGVSLKGDTFDGDRTRIVYAIDKLLYDEKKIPNFTLGPKGNYTGDTINTFRTLFGNRFNNTEEYVEKLFDFTPEQIIIKNNFFRTYQKIGNFYILPTGQYSITKKTLNTYRGTDKNYKDFFDVFIRNLYSNEDVILVSLKQKDNNKEFFEKFKSKKDFCELFDLSENIDFHHPATKNGVKCNYRNFKYLNITKEEYINFAFNYINEATILINTRSEIIVNKLKKELNS